MSATNLSEIHSIFLYFKTVLTKSGNLNIKELDLIDDEVQRKQVERFRDDPL